MRRGVFQAYNARGLRSWHDSPHSPHSAAIPLKRDGTGSSLSHQHDKSQPASQPAHFEAGNKKIRRVRCRGRCRSWSCVNTDARGRRQSRNRAGLHAELCLACCLGRKARRRRCR